VLPDLVEMLVVNSSDIYISMIFFFFFYPLISKIEDLAL
jgi:hypothetical protein